ncbi:MAG: RluA family pseudouridine synthase [bacterium]|nr:RluA family pseudouridine synthase [bacterium]
MEPSILFEDASFILIDKPPGIVVNKAESVKGLTIQDWVDDKFKVQSEKFKVEVETEFINRSGIVHRIDKETSGLLMIAKTPAAFLNLQAQFKERVVKKTYLAIVHGQVDPADGEINAPVGRLPWNRERFGVFPGGKEAVTRYKVQSLPFTVHSTIVSLVEVYPETGRTHQIRVHMKYIHHPIVGDYQYAGRKTSRDDRTWAPRVMLHAWKISFRHPESGENLAFEAPIPDDMKRIIE